MVQNALFPKLDDWMFFAELFQFLSETFGQVPDLKME